MDNNGSGELESNQTFKLLVYIKQSNIENIQFYENIEKHGNCFYMNWKATNVDITC